jgi:predicted TPR repeat methyltransferase
VYDRLEVGEIVATLRQAREAFDLLTAGDVLCYIGELSDTVAAAFQALRPGGHFAFTVEESQSPEWTLLPSRRYAHSAAYIRKIAERHGFEIAHLVSMVLRKEGGKDLFGLVVILHRPAKTPQMDTEPK